MPGRRRASAAPSRWWSTRGVCTSSIRRPAWVSTTAAEGPLRGDVPMKSKFRLYVLALVVAAFGLAITGCGDDDGGGGGGGSGEQVSGNLSISGVWTGQEARSFNAVLDGFKQDQPNVNVRY